VFDSGLLVGRLKSGGEKNLITEPKSHKRSAFLQKGTRSPDPPTKTRTRPEVTGKFTQGMRGSLEHAKGEGYLRNRAREQTQHKERKQAFEWGEKKK